jgi:hypothetical protein
MPHVSWQVDDMDRAIQGKPLAVGPIQGSESIRIAYFFENGALVEYLEIQRPHPRDNKQPSVNVNGYQPSLGAKP